VGLAIQPILREPFVAVLPARHKLGKKTAISPAELKDEPFVLFSRAMGSLAYDRTVACCEADGFRPNLVQHAPQWPTVLRLVAAGLGVSLVPACVASLAMPGVVFKRVRSRHWTSVDIGMKAKPDNPAATVFPEGRGPVLFEGRKRIRQRSRPGSRRESVSSGNVGPIMLQ
jgi:DNA-binding transcriptional LysR family regulator